jgi:hypothetical protein
MFDAGRLTAPGARAGEAPMANPRIPFTIESEGAWSPEAHLVDEMVDCYLEWRESAAAVGTAYQQWFHAPRAEERRRYSAYAASLDQEESAATTYEMAVADVQQWLERSRPLHAGMRAF